MAPEVGLSQDARRLLALLHNGETVSIDFSTAWRGWVTSGGRHVHGSAVYALVCAGLAEYFEYGTAITGKRIGTKARIKPRPAKAA